MMKSLLHPTAWKRFLFFFLQEVETALDYAKHSAGPKEEELSAYVYR